MTRSNKTPSKPEKPRNLLPAEVALLNELKRTLTITQDGKPQQISVGLAVIRKLEQVALSGSPHALGQLMKYLQKAQEAQNALIEHDIEIGMFSLNQAKERLEDAIKRRLDPNLVVPHPDDYAFSNDKGWEMRGPWNAEELNIILGNVKRRDLMIMQTTLEERLATKAEWQAGKSPTTDFPGKSAWIMVHFLNNGLPERFHLEIIDMINIQQTYLRMTKRELLKYAVDRWRKVGDPKPRGWRMEPFQSFHPRFTQANAVARDMVNKANADHPVSVSDIHRLFSEFRRSQ